MQTSANSIVFNCSNKVNKLRTAADTFLCRVTENERTLYIYEEIVNLVRIYLGQFLDVFFIIRFIPLH